MKKFFIFLALLICFFVWFRGWVSSGEMDAFIRRHPHPDYTPRILYIASQVYYICQKPNSAARYYRWIIEDYPTHHKIAKIRWQLGRSYEELSQHNMAIEQYAILRDSFSATQQGQLATKKCEQFSVPEKPNPPASSQ